MEILCLLHSLIFMDCNIQNPMAFLHIYSMVKLSQSNEFSYLCFHRWNLFIYDFLPDFFFCCYFCDKETDPTMLAHRFMVMDKVFHEWGALSWG